MSSPERKDANLPFSFFPQPGSTAAQPHVCHAARSFPLLSALQIPTLLAALLLPLSAANLFAEHGSEDYVFHPVTIVAGGYVPGIIAHPTEPGLIYARTDIGSVYRWHPENQRWRPLTDFHSPQDYNLNGPESVALETMLRATCEPSRFLDLIENFLLFEDARGGLRKVMA